MCKDFSKDHCNSTFLTSFLGWNLAGNFWLAIHTAMSRKDYASAKWRQLNLRPQILGSLKKKTYLVLSSDNNLNEAQHLQLLLNANLSP